MFNAMHLHDITWIEYFIKIVATGVAFGVISQPHATAVNPIRLAIGAKRSKVAVIDQQYESGWKLIWEVVTPCMRQPATRHFYCKPHGV